MAKSKTRSGSAKRSAKRAKKSAKPARKTARKRAKRTSRRPAGRKARAAETRSRRGSAAKHGRSGKKTRARSRVGKAKGGPRRAAPLANPRGSSGAGTNPWPTRPSTRTGSGAGSSRSPYLERARRQLREIEETIPGPPSSLDMDRHGTAARTGRDELREALHEHTETSPAFTGGDVDADWQNAYATGDESPGGDNPTPDQDRVDDIGKSLGVQYDDNEELKSVDKISDRDKHRWELDPASAEDYKDRQK
jgi:hypothetical protein